MKSFILKKLKYIILFLIILVILYIIIIQNLTAKKRSYIQPLKVDLYDNQSSDNIDKNEKNSENTENLKLLEDYKNKKLLVLTFDDGPGNYTSYLVDELEKRNVKATFFILGQNIKGHEDVLKKTAKNNEIALHSYSHKLFTKLSNKEILKDIDEVKNEIYNVINIEPKVIRVPYGSLNSRVTALLLENGYTSVTWDIDSRDWSFRNVDKTYNYTMKYLKGNSIILMHDIYKTSVESALKLIDNLEGKYTFVTLSKFLEIENLSKSLSKGE